MPDPIKPSPKPSRLDLKRDRDLTITWPDGRVDVWTIAQLRQRCPCAACKIQRTGRDPHQLMQPVAEPQPSETEGTGKRLSLTVASKPIISESDPITVTTAEPVGNYAIRLNFSDGHQSGIFSWAHLRDLSDARYD